MAGSLDSLISNITDSVQNLISTITGAAKNTPGLYATDKTQVGSVLNFKGKPSDRAAQANWNTQTPYSFSVKSVGTASSNGSSSNTSNAAANPFQEFKLPLAPGKITQTEHIATSIKSTQGGTVVSHSGNKYKTLTISGTTGVAPFRGAGGANTQTGVSLTGSGDLKYASGFQVFIELRNYFKSYYQYKSTQKNVASQNLRLIWNNYKDGEFLVVELIDFQMDRNANRSFLYDYNMTFKVLAPYDVAASSGSNISDLQRTLNAATEFIDTARAVMLQTQGILQQVSAVYQTAVLDPLRQASLAIKAFRGIGKTAADIANTDIKATMTVLAALGILSTVASQQAAQNQSNATQNPILAAVKLPTDLKAATALNPAQSVINLGPALSLLSPTDFPATTQTAFEAEQAKLLTSPKSFFKNIHSQIKDIQYNAEDSFGLGSAEYDRLFNRTATSSGYPGQQVTNDQYSLLAAFNQALLGLEMFLANEDFFANSYDNRITSIVDAFDGNISLDVDPATIQIILQANTDLERLSLTYLGDPDRWPEIAELNGLSYPYIIQDMSDTTNGVKHPGDSILIPALETFGFSQLPVGAEITSGPQLDALEQSFGADLKVTKDFDLDLGNDGDLQIVQSTENVAQAVSLKLAYEPGELISNPTIGVGLSVGEKNGDLNIIRDNLVRSLLQDTRVSGISDLSLQRTNNLLVINFDLSLKQVDTPIPVEIPIPTSSQG